MPAGYRITPLGDQGIIAELGDEIDESTSERCLALAARISGASIHGIKDIVPAYTSVAVLYDAVQVSKISGIISPSLFMRQQVETFLTMNTTATQTPGRHITIPACFDVSLGPDLTAIATMKGMEITELVRQFIAKEYRVYMLGFLPGFAYMGRVDDALAMPRKDQPQPIAAGSIGIAGNQTGIYPLASPGGWTIIGRTPLKMFDPRAENPCRLQAGDHVRFEPVTIEIFHQLNENL